MNDKLKPQHLERKAVVYVRQSSPYQVAHNEESRRLQYAMRARLEELGWREIEVVDDDLGCTARGVIVRAGFDRMVAVVYSPRLSNDRLLLGLKGSFNEYELDLLRQRSLEARYAKARRGELIVSAPVGFLKTEDQRFELHPDQRVQERIRLVFQKFLELVPPNGDQPC